MTAVFAFGVAAPVQDAPAPSAEYDPVRQQLVWDGDGDASLGWPLCTGGRYYGKNPCRTTSTACYGTSCATSSYAGCYACDYG